MRRACVVVVTVRGEEEIRVEHCKGLGGKEEEKDAARLGDGHH